MGSPLPHDVDQAKRERDILGDIEEAHLDASYAPPGHVHATDLSANDISGGRVPDEPELEPRDVAANEVEARAHLSADE